MWHDAFVSNWANASHNKQPSLPAITCCSGSENGQLCGANGECGYDKTTQTSRCVSERRVNQIAYMYRRWILIFMSLFIVSVFFFYVCLFTFVCCAICSCFCKSGFYGSTCTDTTIWVPADTAGIATLGVIIVGLAVTIAVFTWVVVHCTAW